MYYQLTVKFAEKDTELLYRGISYLHERSKKDKHYTQDTLEIRRDKIVLSFERSTIDSENVLFTTKSLVRYEIQRALCYYLAVVGYMPRINRIYIKEYKTSLQDSHNKPITGKKANRIRDIQDITFASKWEQYKLTHSLQTDIASYIFTNGAGAKAVYDGLTYFEAAQQNSLRDMRDCYRAAWSCLNALYTYIGGTDSTEQNKLIALGSLFGKTSFEDAKRFVDELTQEQFWSKLDWYQVVLRDDYRTKDEKPPKVYQNVLRLKGDSLLVCQYDKYLNQIKRSVSDQKKFEKNRKEFMEQVQEAIDAGSYDSETRLRFLICRYCYMLRNKSMHAEKAYPMFMITNPVYVSSSVEQKLIDLMLLTAVGIMKEIVTTS